LHSVEHIRNHLKYISAGQAIGDAENAFVAAVNGEATPSGGLIPE
jgi:hypothetical protein